MLLHYFLTNVIMARMKKLMYEHFGNTYNVSYANGTVKVNLSDVYIRDEEMLDEYLAGIEEWFKMWIKALKWDISDITSIQSYYDDDEPDGW